MSGKPTKTEKCKDGLEAKRVNAEPLRPQWNVHAADTSTALCANVLTEQMGSLKDIDHIGCDLLWRMDMILRDNVITDRKEINNIIK